MWASLGKDFISCGLQASTHALKNSTYLACLSFRRTSMKRWGFTQKVLWDRMYLHLASIDALIIGDRPISFLGRHMLVPSQPFLVGIPLP